MTNTTVEDQAHDLTWIYQPMDYGTMSLKELYLFLNAYERAQSYEECALIKKELESRHATICGDDIR